MANPEKPAAKKSRKSVPAPASGETGAENSADVARREKIADIKKALDEGTYRVSDEDVARKVIEHMLRKKS